MGSGFSKQKKQAKMLQDQFSKLQTQLQATEVVGSAGNGLVSITLSGEHELKQIKIKPECVDPEDIEGLEDLIKAAYKDAFSKLKEQNPKLPSLPGMPNLGGFGF
ncbi:YbaB/EbfC family nucleoid-associated protein [Neochlamydia sp. EPS4]|uniref:YbaB/EbfC family nucleoid-associated protein n=1 Tax=Neochlamydia sp. EPS4 TaxID=1478175 RepID=UPI0005D12F4B|nr:YbaB/EbfC family nucleoid-associated protein [Neochlamydia sp. EPS4]